MVDMTGADREPSLGQDTLTSLEYADILRCTFVFFCVDKVLFLIGISEGFLDG